MEDFNTTETLTSTLWAMHPEIKVFVADGVGFSSYRLPGSEKLADVTAEAFLHHRIIVWEKHGCVAIGKNVVQAFDLIDIVNKGAMIYLLCKSAGYTPQGISRTNLKELEDTYGKNLID